ncbi:HAMP domain-containing histidine kinase [bacterium]|nr:HAMP domain-containing histidine kinase [bacterium]
MKSFWLTRKHFLVFFVLALVALAQLGWWVIFQVGEGARLKHVQQTLWEQQIELAQHWREARYPDVQEFRIWLGESFPDLELKADGRTMGISSSALARLDHMAGGRVRMFVWEGLFFTLILGVGIGYIYWMLRREIVMERRQAVFLTATSHELKTPITSLRLYLDTLIDHDVPAAQRAEILATMQQDLQRLTNLIDHLLQAQSVIQKKKHHRIKQTVETINLAEETQEVLHQVEDMFNRKGIRLKSKLDERLFSMVDPMRWQTLVMNLLDNACKYSPQGSAVELILEQNGSHAILRIVDEGIGIPKAEFDRIFERFYRIDNKNTLQTGGTGLGLYIVKETVEELGGTVSVESQGIGKGTTFTAEIPLADEDNLG